MKKTKAIFHQPVRILTSVGQYDGMFVKERMISFIPPENSCIKFGKGSFGFDIAINRVYLDIGESGDEIVSMDIYCKILIDDISSYEDVHKSNEEFKEILAKNPLVKQGWTLQ